MLRKRGRPLGKLKDPEQVDTENAQVKKLKAFVKQCAWEHRGE